MHIRPAQPSQPHSGQQTESGTNRKLRLGGGASRVPIQTNKKLAETPLRALVSAIGQSLGTRTPLRGQAVGSRTPSSARSSLFSSAGKPSSTTPADGTRSKSLFSVEGRTTSSAATRSTAAGTSSGVPSTPRSSRSQATSGTPSKTPATPISTRVRASAGTPSKTPATTTSTRIQAFAGTPSRRSSLSSSSSSSQSITSNTAKEQSISSATPKGRKLTPIPSTARKSDPTVTPVAKKSSIPPRTPRAQNNPPAPMSKPSFIPAPTPRRPAVSSPGGKQISTPPARTKSFLPTTPILKPTSANPSTPGQGDNVFSTPSNQHGSYQTFYTPTSTLPLTPLQPKNLPESSRKLHFGINVAAMADQENLGDATPRSASAVITEATFSFGKSRLAQIKARQNASQLLNSPAQRIRAPNFQQALKTSSPRAAAGCRRSVHTL